MILQYPTDSNAYLKIDQEAFLLATTTVHEKAMLVVDPLDQGGKPGLKDCQTTSMLLDRPRTSEMLC